MNKVYLLLSFFIFVLIIIMSYDASEVQSYIDGNIMLKVYTSPNGSIIKREYFIDGTVARMLEYSEDATTKETLYDEEGKKVMVNIFENGVLVKTTNYKIGIIPMISGSREVSMIVKASIEGISNYCLLFLCLS